MRLGIRELVDAGVRARVLLSRALVGSPLLRLDVACSLPGGRGMRLCVPFSA